MPPYNTERAFRPVRNFCDQLTNYSLAGGQPARVITDGLFAGHQDDALTSERGRECLVSDHGPPDLPGSDV